MDPTLENVALELVPIAVTATMQTMMMRANMTAYSTAVGPSSAFRKRTSGLSKYFMVFDTFIV